MKYLLIIFIALIPTLGFATATLSPSELASAKSQLKNAIQVFEHVSIGTIANRKYVLISYITNADATHQNKLEDVQGSINRFALFSFENGKISLITATKPMISYGPRDGINCDIKNEFIVLSHWNSSTSWSSFNETWKFRAANGKFHLVGYDAVNSEYVGDKDSPQYNEIATSINFLSNEVAHWRKTGSSIKEWNESVTWQKPFNIIKADKHKEYRFKFNKVNDIYFDTFDDASFTKLLKNNKNLFGSVNEQYVYEPY